MPFERIGPYRIGFYSQDVHGGEPPHVHVTRENDEVKIWLNDLTIAYNYGFTSNEVRKISQVIAQYRQHFLIKWEEYRASI